MGGVVASGLGLPASDGEEWGLRQRSFLALTIVATVTETLLLRYLLRKPFNCIGTGMRPIQGARILE